MWVTSDAFRDVLKSNYRQWSTRVEFVSGTEIVVASDVLESGYVSIDNVAVRRELHATFVDAEGVLTPATTKDLLSPVGTEMRVYRGLYIPSVGDYEWVPLGVFGLVKPEVRSHSDGVVVEVKGFDRVDAVRVRRFTEPWRVPSGSLVTQAISDIVTSRLPNVSVQMTPSTFTTPEIVFDRLSDPWDAVRALASAAAMVAYFDPLGNLVITSSTPIETGVQYEIGKDTALLMNVTRSMDSSETYSGVMVRGENPDLTTFAVEKWDLDPNSPTYSLGPFGRRPVGYFSELITTIAQAQAVADQMFLDEVQIAQEAEVTTVGTPAHDVDDVIIVNDPRSKTSGRWRIISGTIPLRPTQEDLLRWRCTSMN